MHMYACMHVCMYVYLVYVLCIGVVLLSPVHASETVLSVAQLLDVTHSGKEVAGSAVRDDR